MRKENHLPRQQRRSHVTNWNRYYSRIVSHHRFHLQCVRKSSSLELLFSNTVQNFTGCFISKKGLLNTTDTIMKVPLNNALYHITLPIKENAQTSAQVANNVDVYYQR